MQRRGDREVVCLSVCPSVRLTRQNAVCTIAQLLVFSTPVEACIKKMSLLVRCYEGPLSVLFAYDAVAYYMWKLDSVPAAANFSKYAYGGDELATSARNTICEHGTCFNASRRAHRTSGRQHADRSKQNRKLSCGRETARRFLLCRIVVSGQSKAEPPPPLA